MTRPETAAMGAARKRLQTPLYRARTNAGLSAQELAERAGFGENGVWVIIATELRAAQPTDETAEVIHRVLGLPPGTIDFPSPIC
jgi:ribosome-binding protein aMBF1 (putative translation factor)